jgi:hypothetical protein
LTGIHKIAEDKQTESRKRKTVLGEEKIIVKSWNEIKHTARHRVRWKNLVETLWSEMKL